MFIKLNKVEDHTDNSFFDLYINTDKVTEFYKINRFGKSFTNVFTGKEYFTVKETPEEIMSKIEEASATKFIATSGSATLNPPFQVTCTGVSFSK